MHSIRGGLDNTMLSITDIKLLDQMKLNGALLILFGGEHCGVCQSIKPQIIAMLEQQFPDMQGIYIDCETSTDICAQHSVFTLPVVKAYIDGMKVAEFGRSFSLTQLADAIDRPYSMWKNSF